MGAWLYQWDNGDVSLVIASSRADAAFVLDEFGPAEPDRLKPINNVAIDFPMMRSGKDFKKGQLTDGLYTEILDLVEDYTKRGKREQFEKEMADHNPPVCPAPPSLLPPHSKETS